MRARQLGEWLWEWGFIAEMVGWAFPAVGGLLGKYQLLVDAALVDMPESKEAHQAAVSMRSKKFHCQGGAAYACRVPRRAALLQAIVALQTMSDYLDNLCDRGDPPRESRFRALHRPLQAAVAVSGAAPHPASALGPSLAAAGPSWLTPAVSWRAPASSGLAAGPVAEASFPRLADGGLLNLLVEDSRSALAALPSYRVVEPYVRQLVDLYCDLQCYKHLVPGEREETLERWYRRCQLGGVLCRRETPLPWHEFAAASGSTLGMFALFRLAARPGVGPDAARACLESYFPYVCALHILLDYLIDRGEDEESGDLNFTAFYGAFEAAIRRLRYFVHRALAAVDRLPEPWFHRLVVKGLVAMYLSDPKVAVAGRQPLAPGHAPPGESASADPAPEDPGPADPAPEDPTLAGLLDAAGPPASAMWRLCRRLRSGGMLADSWQPGRAGVAS